MPRIIALTILDVMGLKLFQHLEVLAFAVPERIRARLEVMNIDLGERQGDGRWMLPIPVTIVVGRKGEVVRIFTACGLDLDMEGIVATVAGLK